MYALLFNLHTKAYHINSKKSHEINVQGKVYLSQAQLKEVRITENMYCVTTARISDLTQCT